MARERDIALLETVKAYIALTKPRIIELLLVAAIPAMLQADRGHVHVGLILLTLFGGWMGAAAAHTFNMVMDYDIDQKMRRTRRRPLARNQVSRRAAAIFGTILMIASFLWLWLLCNSLLAAVFILITIAFYIFVYTLWLKRRTDQNVIWGGAAGCMPVMVGWAVITDNNPEITGLAHWWQAFILFLLIFFWTPPHTWALGLRYKEDYKAAGVPMMPVVKPAIIVSKRIIYYTAATVITTLLLVPYAGWIYLIGAVGAGAWFLWGAIDLHRHVKTGGKIKPMKLFFMSNNYLSIVCVALSLDAVLGLQTVLSMF
ncbi:protoheme IX farnesyltransferase [Corynebacterium sp. HMSC063A05]|uniref:heme o synthase n=1 Tax=Corynebacterium TaxID=1716 RepID=UPI0006685DA2|nr:MULTISPECIES: heme o synthase [Corynebacterium]KAA9270320.1 protoheme IX farnesyltransferase [Corynebacterium amycolatum]MDK8819194.1 heme o synthase [Corynebacterium amycolatum]OFM84941.1 protoheme IX farnesyltransferase [Corynebacterium sp. HMSC063A05]OFN08950.1 protoheme IX farnesyltransferase [Corynebacterium sp. HMSC074C11]